MPLSREVAGVLRASVQAGTPESSVLGLVDGHRLDGLAHAAAIHGVTGYTYHAVRQTPGLPQAECEQLSRNYHGLLHTHLRALADLAVIAETFSARRLGWCVVKGPVLSEVVHARPDLRAYADLDVLVSGAFLPAAVDSLERAGAVLLDRNWQLLRREVKGEVHLRLPHGTVADLHWCLLNNRAERDAFILPTTELLDRVRSVHVGPVEVPTLDATDTVLHLMVHTMLSGGHRLVWFKDIERAASVTPVDWPDLVRRAHAYGTGLLSAVALDTTRRLVGLPLPDGISSELSAARSWRLIAAAAQRVSPIERASGEGSVNRIVARATRATGRASVRELGRRSAQWCIRRASRQARSPAGPMDPAGPGSMHFVSGDIRDLDAYYRSVAALTARSERSR